MKCLKNSKTNEVVRVDDFEADILVSVNPNWRYCAKHEWKATRKTGDGR